MDEDAPTHTEYELALDIACGDEDAIRAFITLHGPKIRGFLKRRFEPVWEDAWQETLIRLVIAIDRFDPAKGSLRVWATKLAQNCAISILRAERKHCCTEVHEGIEEDRRRPTQEVLTPKQQKDRDRRAQLIQKSIEALPDKERRVIVADLADSDGKAPAGELALAWNTSDNAIHQARSRARTKLREELVRRGVFGEGAKA